MADQSKNKSAKPVASFAVETQQERWIKYGANVALSVVIVLALMGRLPF